MLDFLSNLFYQFEPHGYCYLWNPFILWLHVISDAIIGISYYSMPMALLYFFIKRKDIPFGFLLVLFAAFIVLCGTTHFMNIFVTWFGMYGAEGGIKLCTAIVSIGVAIKLWQLMPFLISLPGREHINLLMDANAALRNSNEGLLLLVHSRDELLSAQEKTAKLMKSIDEALRSTDK